MARLDFLLFLLLLTSFKCCKKTALLALLANHSLVVVCLFLKCVKPSSAYWYFNTALLEVNNFKEVFVSFGKNLQNKKNEFIYLQQWWDFGKVQTEQLCQQYDHNVTKVLSESSGVRNRRAPAFS